MATSGSLVKVWFPGLAPLVLPVHQPTSGPADVCVGHELPRRAVCSQSPEALTSETAKHSGRMPTPRGGRMGGSRGQRLKKEGGRRRGRLTQSRHVLTSCTLHSSLQYYVCFMWFFLHLGKNRGSTARSEAVTHLLHPATSVAPALASNQDQ